MTSTSDDELMKQIGQGHQGAFKELFSRHCGKVLGYATRLLKDKERAEDLSQEVWIKVVKQAPHYVGSDQFIAWAYTITRNAAFNILRSEKKFSGHVSVDDENVAELAGPSDLLRELSLAEDKALVHEAIDSLPEMQRAALMTWITEDINYEELAGQLDVSVPAVKSLLFRARQTVVAFVKKKEVSS